jgi:hypothetical protein
MQCLLLSGLDQAIEPIAWCVGVAHGRRGISCCPESHLHWK